jgi:hypothetical protein
MYEPKNGFFKQAELKDQVAPRRLFNQCNRLMDLREPQNSDVAFKPMSE